jgi:hypothetical protein
MQSPREDTNSVRISVSRNLKTATVYRIYHESRGRDSYGLLESFLKGDEGRRNGMRFIPRKQEGLLWAIEKAGVTTPQNELEESLRPISQYQGLENLPKEEILKSITHCALEYIRQKRQRFFNHAPEDESQISDHRYLVAHYILHYSKKISDTSSFQNKIKYLQQLDHFLVSLLREKEVLLKTRSDDSQHLSLLSTVTQNLLYTRAAIQYFELEINKKRFSISMENLNAEEISFVIDNFDRSILNLLANQEIPQNFKTKAIEYLEQFGTYLNENPDIRDNRNSDEFQAFQSWLSEQNINREYKNLLSNQSIYTLIREFLHWGEDTARFCSKYFNLDQNEHNDALSHLKALILPFDTECLSSELNLSVDNGWFFNDEIAFPDELVENITNFINIRNELEKSAYVFQLIQEIHVLSGDLSAVYAPISLKFTLETFISSLEKIESQLLNLDEALLRFQLENPRLNQNEWLTRTFKHTLQPYDSPLKMLIKKLIQAAQGAIDSIDFNEHDFYQLNDNIRKLTSIAEILYSPSEEMIAMRTEQERVEQYAQQFGEPIPQLEASDTDIIFLRSAVVVDEKDQQIENLQDEMEKLRRELERLKNQNTKSSSDLREENEQLANDNTRLRGNRNTYRDAYKNLLLERIEELSELNQGLCRELSDLIGEEVEAIDCESISADQGSKILKDKKRELESVNQNLQDEILRKTEELETLKTEKEIAIRQYKNIIENVFNHYKNYVNSFLGQFGHDPEAEERYRPLINYIKELIDSNLNHPIEESHEVPRIVANCIKIGIQMYGNFSSFSEHSFSNYLLGLIADLEKEEGFELENWENSKEQIEIILSIFSSKSERKETYKSLLDEDINIGFIVEFENSDSEFSL